MPDQSAIDDALKTVAEDTFGAGTIDLEPKDQIPPETGALVFNGYDQERLPYQQDRVVYEYVLAFKRKAGATARTTVSDELEAVREALRTDAPLLALVDDVRVTSLLVQSMKGGQVLGAMLIEAEVIR